MSASSTPPPGTHDRPAGRGNATPLVKVGLAVFAVGLVAIAVDLALFFTGSENLPVWLNVMCMLAPVGLGVCLVGVVKETRRASPALVARAEAAVAADQKDKANRRKFGAKRRASQALRGENRNDDRDSNGSTH
ncbi:hypothetical protein EH165_02890 [Nakamurella antarctica]|uniref:Uncharacterized protein n=1 Tax=Nakamurella antarctica TaxID=1902245 RepID=A0A3G8ZIP3_9ACTN|nr:hypothetical protein [Nakamurella antarctica]AZI57262.1 hypothetical protein EH165_02890 [Nakamurella antarctica]